MADRLRQARRDKGIATVKEAAEALKIAYPTYSAHENGSRNFQRDDAVRYAQFFGVSVDWLLTGRGSMRHKGADPLVEQVRNLPPGLREEVQEFIHFRTSRRK